MALVDGKARVRPDRLRSYSTGGFTFQEADPWQVGEGIVELPVA